MVEHACNPTLGRLKPRLTGSSMPLLPLLQQGHVLAAKKDNVVQTVFYLSFLSYRKGNLLVATPTKNTPYSSLKFVFPLNPHCPQFSNWTLFTYLLAILCRLASNL
jgi:hypothetical protein